MWGAVAFALGASACAQPTQRSVIAVPAAHTQGEGRPMKISSPFELSSRPDDAVVRLVTDVTCTGTLVAEDLVLTAHHCVAARDAKGRPLNEDRAPDEISVEIGGDYLPWGEVSVRAIVSPDCGYSAGDGDIAILVLSRRLIGITTMTPRISGEPQGPRKDEDNKTHKGEEVIPIGFGRCARSQGGVHRVWRPSGEVRTVLPGQFVALASVCPGDSGAPGYSIATGQIVGVVSASVMDGDERTVGTSYFTRLDVWKNLFSAAREIADGASPSELPPYRSCAPAR